MFCVGDKALLAGRATTNRAKAKVLKEGKQRICYSPSLPSLTMLLLCPCCLPSKLGARPRTRMRGPAVDKIFSLYALAKRTGRTPQEANFCSLFRFGGGVLPRHLPHASRRWYLLQGTRWDGVVVFDVNAGVMHDGRASECVLQRAKDNHLLYQRTESTCHRHIRCCR